MNEYGTEWDPSSRYPRLGVASAEFGVVTIEKSSPHYSKRVVPTPSAHVSTERCVSRAFADLIITALLSTLSTAWQVGRSVRALRMHLVSLHAMHKP